MIMQPVGPPNDHRSVEWTTFNGPEEFAAAFRDWGMEVTQLRAETGEHWVASSKLHNVQFWATHLTGRYRIRAGLPERMVLMQLDLGPTGTRSVGGAQLSKNDILVGFGRAQLEGVLAGEHHGVSFIVPESIVLGALEARVPRAADLMRRPSPYVISYSGPGFDVLRRFVEAALMPRGLPQEHFLANEILDALIDALASSCQEEDPLAYRVPRTQRLPIVRRVEEFMRGKLSEPLMLHDFCQAARASQRTVEYAFSSVYGMGPKQYLKVLRLNEVRRVLKSEPRQEASIKAVAYRMGFWHLGHFFTDYRRLFGETPEQARTQR
jgi:AraC family transcriptional regulator, ethanolamine operon transcriptional activator